MQPPRVQVLLSLAGVHADPGEQDLARALTLQAAAREPENTAVAIARGNVATATGDVVEARQSNRNPFSHELNTDTQPTFLLPDCRDFRNFSCEETALPARPKAYNCRCCFCVVITTHL
jgi:hypothetical protein